MTTYVMLMKFTDEGVKNVKKAPARIDVGIKRFEAMHGKVVAFYPVMGEYDYVAVGEAPCDDIAATFSLGLASQGNVRVTTLRAFSKEQFSDVVRALP